VNDTRPKASPPRWKRVLKASVSVAVVGGIFLGAMPAIADYGEVWATITRLSILEVGGLVLVGLWNIATYWLLMVAVLPGLSLPQAAVVNQASTAVSNTLPGGGAIGVGVSYSMYRSWGFGLESIGLATLVSGVWNTFAKLGLPVLAVALLAFAGGAGAVLFSAALVGVLVLVGTIVIFWMMLRSEAAARRVGRAVQRAVNRIRRLLRRGLVSDWDEAAVGFCGRIKGLVRDRWTGITVAAVISHLSLYAVLLVSLRAVGLSQAELGWIQVLASFAFVRLISALPITPGGVGVVELGYAASLTVGLGAEASAQVVAAVLLFRFITYVLPIPFGAIAYIVWRRNRSWRASEATA